MSELDEHGGWPALLGALLDRGHPLFGFDVGACIDVDRPEDIAAAERLLGVTAP